MRKNYGWLVLFTAVLLTAMSLGVLVTLADESLMKHSGAVHSAAVLNATFSNATVSDSTVSNATASNAASSNATASDADFPTATPSGQDAEPDEVMLLMDLPAGGCTTQEELIEQLLDESRDRIVLASDIEWSAEDSVDVSGEKEVEMGDYRILVGSENRFEVNGNVTFRGSGRRGSLFEIRGLFAAGEGVKICAEGDRAVAVNIVGSDWNGNLVEIYSRGTDARAVCFTGLEEATIEACKVEAEGDGSVGIVSKGPLRIFLSSVSGEKAAAISGSGELQAFGCRLSPEPDHGEMIPALVAPFYRHEENGICIAAGSTQEELLAILEGYNMISWNFFSEREEANVIFDSLAVWNDLPEDISHTGTYVARWTPTNVPDWLPIELYSLEVPIHVVDPGRPFIMSAEDAGEAAFLSFFAPVQDAQKLRIEYSTDDRESWRDAAELPGSFVLEELANVEPLEPNQDYWFRLIVEGGPMEGMSNEILFIGDVIRKANGGGDRDHGDRDDQGELPPHGTIIPPPDDEGSETSGGSYSGDTGTSGTILDGGTSDSTDPSHTGPGETGPESADAGQIKPDETKPGGADAGQVMPDGTPHGNADADHHTPNETSSGATDAVPVMTDGTNQAKAASGPTVSAGQNQGSTAADQIAEPVTSRDSTESDRLGWITILCVIFLGGGVYACWKRHKKNR